MNRFLILAALPLAVGAVVLSSATAQSQTADQASSAQSTPDRAFTERITARTTPRRDRRRPYRFTTRGRIVPPSTFCAPNVEPTRSANCIAIVCLPGIRDARYCARPTITRICSGRVNVRFQRRGATVSSRNARLRPDCTYRSRVPFSTSLKFRKGIFTVRARFQGNQVLRPKRSSKRRVRAG